jgi:hypothetical protein
LTAWATLGPARGVVLLWKPAGTSDYLGLGVPTILRALSDPRRTLPQIAERIEDGVTPGRCQGILIRA